MNNKKINEIKSLDAWHRILCFFRFHIWELEYEAYAKRYVSRYCKCCGKEEKF